MHKPRIIKRPAFHISGKKTWISGQDTASFGKFWDRCRAEGLFEIFTDINGLQPGVQTGGVTLGVSRVEENPANRAFHYMIAIENPHEDIGEELESYWVPAVQWAVFECRGKVPEAIVKAEMFAFMEAADASKDKGGCPVSIPEMMQRASSGDTSKN